MVRKSSKLVALFLVFTFVSSFAQKTTSDPNDKDYKDRVQFERFAKRRKVIGAWQVNQLRKGALVVKLRTNQMVIDALKKQGNEKLAEQKRLETAAVNRNIIKAFLDEYHFSKVYFVYSNMADTLRTGVRSNVFVDSTLTVNPSITMQEKFYLLAESDRIYNSSIGFVPQDSARYVLERGNPTGGDAAIVVKNKFGHQLKRPFPFYSGDQSIILKEVPSHVYINLYGERVPFNVGGAGKLKSEEVMYKHNNEMMALYIPKSGTYEFLKSVVTNFDESLTAYLQRSPEPDQNHKLYAEVSPFLY